ICLRIVFAALSVAGLLATQASAQDAPPRLAADQSMAPAELEALVDGAVVQAMARDRIAGVTVSVVQDGRVVLKKGYGFADVETGRRVDPDATLFRVGSITKTFTWLMALNAAEQGRMSLDAPINRYLPAGARIPDQDGMRQVSLRDLMVHQPGFEERLLKDLFFRDQARLRPLDEYLAAHRPDRIWAPGEVSAYSNYGAALAGAAVAHSGRARWEDLLEAEILRPAGMTRTTGREPYDPRADLPAPMPANLARDLSRNYRWTGAAFAARPYEFGGFPPAGSMSSTASDMARYMTLLLNGGTIDGGTIYGPAAAKAILTPMVVYPGGGGANAGFFQTPLRGGFMAYGHNGATLDFHANMTVIPDLRLG
ncbi:MAG: serine hydrolase domain-containing protein, partial [Phenylobacterium sp.]